MARHSSLPQQRAEARAILITATVGLVGVLAAAVVALAGVDYLRALLVGAVGLLVLTLALNMQSVSDRRRAVPVQPDGSVRLRAPESRREARVHALLDTIGGRVVTPPTVTIAAPRGAHAAA